MVAAPLLRDGHKVGQVFAYAGQPSWVFMTVEAESTPHQVICELTLAGGRTVRIGTFSVSSGYHSWGSTVNVAASDITGVRLLDSSGNLVATAAL